MATTKKLSFGLDKAGGAALILARIGAALLWIMITPEILRKLVEGLR